MAEVKRLLAANRLVTLVGIGGAGKTRLALEVATQVAGAYPAGAWLADLGPVVDGALVGQQLANALSVPESSEQTPISALIQRLRHAHVLIVVDNCERVLDGCAEVCEQLLGATDSVRMLATSRERLNLRGELVWTVPPLSLTVPEHGPAITSEAAELFWDRAGSVRPDLHPTAEVAQVVHSICKRLDGLPLAIELAAARTRMMPPQEILDLLSDRFRLLTGGSRARLTRHQTLQAALDWSYQLLTPAEQVLLTHLSVFVAGFTLEAAAAVCADDAIASADVLELLTRLVDKSLVMSEGGRTRARYSLLETVLRYTQQKLQLESEQQALFDRHLAYYSELVRRVHPPQAGAPNTGWVETLEEEDENLRAALDWAIGRQPGVALRMAAALARFWALRGRLTEGLRWMQRLLDAATEQSTDRIEALNGAAGLAFFHGDYPRARLWLEESLQLQDQLETRNLRMQAEVYQNLGLIAFFSGEAVRARELSEKSLAIARDVKDSYGIANALFSLALGDYFAGRADSARKLAIESLELRRKVGDAVGVGFASGLLGMIDLDEGDRRGARIYITQALNALSDAGNELNFGIGLEAFARLAAIEGDHSRAVRLAAAAERFRTSAESFVLGPWSEQVQRSIDASRRSLGRQLAERAMAEGQALSPKNAVAYALGTAKLEEVLPAEHSVTPLSRRELEIAELVARGLSNRQLAERLFISVRTAETHINHIYDKLGLDSRTQLSAWWFEHAPSAPKP